MTTRNVIRDIRRNLKTLDELVRQIGTHDEDWERMIRYCAVIEAKIDNARISSFGRCSEHIGDDACRTCARTRAEVLAMKVAAAKGDAPS